MGEGAVGGGPGSQSRGRIATESACTCRAVELVAGGVSETRRADDSGAQGRTRGRGSIKTTRAVDLLRAWKRDAASVDIVIWVSGQLDTRGAHALRDLTKDRAGED